VKAASTSLQAALEERFFPRIESLGFVRDKRQESRIACFRRRTETVVQVFALLWAMRGRPGFWVQFAEAPLNGIDYAGKHFSPEDIMPGNFALARGWLAPQRGQRWFRLSSPWRRLISRQGDEAGAVVQRVIELFPELIAWWENRTKGAHLITFPAAPPRPAPSHAPVFGCPVKPSLLQRFFARDGVWTTGFLGIAVVVDLALAVQAPGLRQMLALVFVGAIAGFMASWPLLKVVWHIRVWMNGGPFHKGDLVQVIAGAHAGKIAAVYEEWPTRNQVRVDLGESEWTEVKDVFSYVQLCKVKKLESPCSPGKVENKSAEGGFTLVEFLIFTSVISVGVIIDNVIAHRFGKWPGIGGGILGAMLCFAAILWSCNRIKVVTPDKECLAQGAKYICQIERGDKGRNGVVRDEQGVILWRYGTRENWPPGRWVENPFRKLDFVISAEGEPKDELVIRRISFLPSAFKIMEAGNSVGTIRMRSFLRIQYGIEIQGAESLTFRLSLFTVRFWGGSAGGAAVWALVGPSKMQWNVLIRPGLDSRKLMAAIAFIHNEWWNYS
jgi:ribosomal protein L24